MESKLVSFVNNVNDSIKSTGNTINNVLDIIDSVVKIIQVVNTTKIKTSDLKVFRNMSKSIVNIVGQISKTINNYSPIFETALKSYPMFSQTTNMMIEQLTLITNKVTDFVKASEPLIKNDLLYKIKLIVSVYIELAVRISKLAYFMLTGKRHRFQIFGKVKPLQLYLGLVAFGILTSYFNKTFTLVAPVFDNIIKLGANHKAVRAGLVALDAILYGQHRVPGLLQIIAKLPTQILSIAPEIIAGYLALYEILKLHNKYITKELNILIDDIIKMGMNGSFIMVGLTTFSTIFFGSGKRGLFGGSRIPGILQVFSGFVSQSDANISPANILSNIQILIEEVAGVMAISNILKLYSKFVSKDLAVLVNDLIVFGALNNQVLMGLSTLSIIFFGTNGGFFKGVRTPGIFEIFAGVVRPEGKNIEIANVIANVLTLIEITTGLLVTTGLLKIFSTITKGPLLKTAQTLAEMGAMSGDIQKGLDVMALILLGGNTGKWFWKKHHLSLFEIIDSIEVKGGYSNFAKKCLLLAILGVVMIFVKVIFKQLDIIGGFKKKKLEKGIYYIETYIPKLINVIYNTIGRRKYQTLLNLLVKIIILTTITTLLIAISTEISLIGLMGISIMLGSVALITLVCGIKITIQTLTQIPYEDILSASSKMLLLFPLFAGELGLITLISLIMRVGMTALDFEFLINFILGSNLLLLSFIGTIMLVNKLTKGKGLETGIGTIKLLIEALIGTATGLSIAALIKEIVSINMQPKDLIGIGLFIVSAISIIMSIAGLSILLNKWKIKLIGGVSLVRMLLTTIIGTAVGLSIATLIKDVVDLSLNLQEFSYIGLFVVASSAIILAFAGVAFLLSKIAAPVVAGTALIAGIMGSCVITAKAIADINKTIEGFSFENMMNFTLVLLALTGVFVVIGLAALILPLSILGISFLTITMTMVTVMAGEMLLLSKIDNSELQKAKDSVDTVFDVCKQIVLNVFGKSLFDAIEIKQEDPWWAKAGKGLLKYIGGPIVNIIGAIVAFVQIFFIFFTITLVLIIAAELRLLQEIHFEKQSILNNVDTIFDVCKQIVLNVFGKSLFDAIEIKQEDPWWAKAGKGLLKYIGGPIVNIIGAIVAFFQIFFIFFTITLILLIAAELKLLTKINLEEKTITDKVDIVLNTAQHVINKIRENRKNNNQSKEQPWWRKALGAIPLVSNISDIIEAICNIGQLAVTFICIGLITLIAKNLKTIQEIELDETKISPKVDEVIRLSNMVVGKVNNSDVAKIDEDQVKGFGDYVDHSVKFFEGINNLKIENVKSLTDMYIKMTEFMKSIEKLDITSITDVLVNKIAPSLQGIHDNLQSKQNTIQQSNNSSQSNIQTTQTNTSPTSEIQTTDYTDILNSIEDVLEKIRTNTTIKSTWGM